MFHSHMLVVTLSFDSVSNEVSDALFSFHADELD